MFLEGLSADCLKMDAAMFKSLGQAMPHFNGGALAFYKEFIFEDEEEDARKTMEVDGEDDVAPPAEEEADGGVSKLGCIKENMCKSGMLFVDLCHGVHAGKFDADFKAMCYTDRGSEPSQTVQAAIAAAARSESQNYEFLKMTKELVRLMNLAQNRSIAPVEGNSAPALSVRALARQRSNPEEDGDRTKEERDSTWRQVTSHRKKFATLSALKADMIEGGVTAAFRSCGPVNKFTGIVNESHRLFVASAELWHENKEEPWTQSSPPTPELWTTACKFVSSQTGPVDFGMAFDGRCRATRRVQEDAFDGPDGRVATARKQSTNVNEIWVVYKGRRAGKLLGRQSRSTVLSANHVEGALMHLPVARNKLVVSKRECYSACGETTTTCGTYTGVEWRSRAELPRIRSTEKANIFKNLGRKDIPEEWVEEYGTNEPLFWQECKPPSFWRALLNDYNIKAVFDVTPGSGALAEACMLEGILYHGVCAAPRGDGLLVCSSA